MHYTSSSLLSPCCKWWWMLSRLQCSVTGTEIVSGNYYLLSLTCSVIFKHTCLLSALFSAILFGPTTESSSGLDSGRQEEYCSRERMMQRRLCWGVTCVLWFLIMYEGKSFNSISFSCCLWICWSNINIMGSLSYCCFVLLRYI